MDLQQRKLNKSEWESIEVPVSTQEISILNMIIAGYDNVNIRVNNNNSIFTHLKIEYTEKMENYLFTKYFKEQVDKIQSTMDKLFGSSYTKVDVNTIVRLNSADKIRLEKNDERSINKQEIYEYVLLNHCEKVVANANNTSPSSKVLFMFHYYTLYKLIRNNIIRLNKNVIQLCKNIITKFEDTIDMSIIIENAVEFIEKNMNLLKYGDLTLYEHQKEIFTICKNKKPKLILYMAPTGTGKTLTPIALSESSKIIFVCAARHVGLALARAAISVNKKIAFAFGCASADDIRLHYFSAKEFTRNKRSGGIGKVDNSIGTYVEIMICDIKSYLPAMYYMLAFNKKEEIITYWDEPTITLDYNEHSFHKIIRQNWKQNIIPTVVLSSATLPKLNELTETISDFKSKFVGSEVFNIISHDCKKSIPIINKDGYVVLPHILSEDYKEICTIATHCEEYLTLSRYFDLKEVVEFITYVNKNNYANSKMKLNRFFETLDDINMKNIKVYYIKLLKNISEDSWNTINNYFKTTRQPRIFSNEAVDVRGNKISKVTSIGPGTTLTKSQHLSGASLTRLTSEQVTSNNLNSKPGIVPVGTSGAYVTTKDAYTLTDGPTIFISNDVEKIGKFCIQQANIPTMVMDDIMKKIDYNNMVNEKLSILERDLENIKEKAEKKVSSVSKGPKQGSNKDLKKFNRTGDEEVNNKGEINKITNEINILRSMIKSATLNETYIPNKPHHIKKWAEGFDTSKAFSSNIDEYIVSDIMSLNGIDDMWKILLMLGIGVFINHENIKYTEIMKKLADEQKLYMIIATSDYIYGTNYQFCHSYLSKDLDLTQEKIIQAMGRVGRNNIQQNYTIRFRDDQQILKLFTSETDKPEIINMNILFNSRKVILVGDKYVEIEDLEEQELYESETYYNEEEEVEVEGNL
uniref:Uncharacterized protein n=1 Tax=viral metagenome TaxID=1070528 RepID=A0A6C0EQI2_9ZZZZ